MRWLGAVLLTGGGVCGAALRCRELRTEVRQLAELPSVLRRLDAEIGVRCAGLSDALRQTAEHTAYLRSALAILAEQARRHPEELPTETLLSGTVTPEAAALLIRAVISIGADAERNHLLLESMAKQAQELAEKASAAVQGRLAVSRALWIGIPAAAAIGLG